MDDDLWSDKSTTEFVPTQFLVGGSCLYGILEQEVDLIEFGKEEDVKMKCIWNIKCA